MPIYDYSCRECGEVSEVLVRTPEGNARCLHCSSQNMEKLVSASYSIRIDRAEPGATCCGREERCEKPSCSTGDTCGRR